jgi:hypothetical protein
MALRALAMRHLKCHSAQAEKELLWAFQCLLSEQYISQRSPLLFSALQQSAV